MMASVKVYASDKYTYNVDTYDDTNTLQHYEFSDRDTALSFATFMLFSYQPRYLNNISEYKRLFNEYING